MKLVHCAFEQMYKIQCLKLILSDLFSQENSFSKKLEFYIRLIIEKVTEKYCFRENINF